MVLAGIVLLTDGESYAIIRKKWSTKMFVVGDVVSFFIQAFGKCPNMIPVSMYSATDTKIIGGGMMTKGTKESADRGEMLVLIGFVIQIAFLGLFMVSALVFHLRLTRLATRSSACVPWVKHVYILYVASLLIMVRSVFRVIEYAQGRDGELMNKQAYLYILDATLMWLVDDGPVQLVPS